MTAGAKALVHPYLRDDGQGGLELVIPRRNGKAEVIGLERKPATAMMRHLNHWFAATGSRRDA